MNRLTALSIAGLTGTALVLTGTSAAQAKIKPGTGIAGIKIGQSQKTVVKKKGQPDKKVSMQVETIGTVKEWWYGQGGSDLTVQLWNKEVIFVSTKDPDQETSKGIGVGSTKKGLVNAYPGVDCMKVNNKWQICQLGEVVAGNNVTTFRLRKKVVKSVEIAQFFD